MPEQPAPQVTGDIPMNAPTDSIAPPRSDPGVSRRMFGSMRARIGVNTFRILLGAVILSSMPWSGPLALLGVIPLAWGAVAFGWIYREHAAQRKPATFVGQ
jgi:hypothetical protein